MGIEEQTNLSDDFEKLKKFLLDIDCLDALSEWTRDVNLFDILHITRAEVRHSYMLSWLLGPNENHGLGDRVLRAFIDYVIISFAVKKDVFETLLMDYHDFVIYREWYNMDILAVSTKEKYVLCIENKIDSGEHDQQLVRYRKTIERVYPNYKKSFIFLSPDGTPSSDPEYWCSMSYSDVLHILDSVQSKVNLLPDVTLFINNYCKTIRRDIVGDERLAKLCAEIYSKHGRALELIFANKPNRTEKLATIIKKWAVTRTQSGIIEVDESKCIKSYIRFKTKYMSELMPESEEPDSGWNTRNHYFYEIRNFEGNAYAIQLSFSSQNMTEDQRAIFNRINQQSSKKAPKENWQWRIVFTSKKCKIDEELPEENIFAQLDSSLKEVWEYEQKLKKYMEQ